VGSVCRVFWPVFWFDESWVGIVDGAGFGGGRCWGDCAWFWDVVVLCCWWEGVVWIRSGVGGGWGGCVMGWVCFSVGCWFA